MHMMGQQWQGQGQASMQPMMQSTMKMQQPAGQASSSMWPDGPPMQMPGNRPPPMEAASAASSVAADDGFQYDPSVDIPNRPVDWREWNEESKRPVTGRGHRHSMSQVRREAWSREALLTSHYEAKLTAQKEWYEGKLMATRADLVAARAILLMNGINMEEAMRLATDGSGETDAAAAKWAKQK